MNRTRSRVAVPKKQDRFEVFANQASTLITVAATKTSDLINKAATTAKVTTMEYCKQIIKLYTGISLLGFTTTLFLSATLGLIALLSIKEMYVNLCLICCCICIIPMVYFIYRLVKVECAPYIVVIEYLERKLRR